ncbi:MAG: MarR family winged helix-turn-helix transcriptional regulator [Acidimicrobiales bacterium]
MASTTAGRDSAVKEALGLRVALVRLHRQLRARSGSGMTQSQASALARIEHSGAARIGHLAELEGTTAATMSRVVDSLEASGLIERVPDPLDGRASLVQLSTEGGAMLQELRARSTETLRRALALMGDDDRALIAAAIPALEQLSDLLQAME